MTKITEFFIKIFDSAHFIMFYINDRDFSFIRITSAIRSYLG